MAITGKDFCTFHDPETVDAMSKGRLAGNAANRRRAEETRPALTSIKPWRGLAREVEVLETASPHEVAVLIGDTIDQVRTGEVTPQIANSIGYLATILVKIHEQIDVEERLLAVEDYIRRHKLERG